MKINNFYNEWNEDPIPWWMFLVTVMFSFGVVWGLIRISEYLATVL